MLIANPLPIVIKILKGFVGVFLPSPFSKAFYLTHLKMLTNYFTTRARTAP